MHFNTKYSVHLHNCQSSIMSRHFNTSRLIHTPVLPVRSRRGRSWRAARSGPPAGRLDTGSAAWQPPAALHGSEMTSDWRLLAPVCAACCPSSVIPWSEKAQVEFSVMCGSSWAGLSLNVLIRTNEKLCHAWLAGLSNLLCIDGRHLCDASNLNHSFWVFSQVQETWGWVQQVTDHLIVDLKRQIKIKKCQLNTNWPSSLWS